jgi:xylulokinase
MFLGIDLGSSSIKLSIYDTEIEEAVAFTSYPDQEMDISSPQQSWAEQSPEIWWDNFIQAYRELVTNFSINTRAIKSIGVSYQMHGLVLVDKNHDVLRPAIIWCDSRAVSVGEELYESLGHDYCKNVLLNSPANFTASKLLWVKQNEPDIFNQIYQIMLPGDYLVMKLSGKITTTPSGLSEGIFWNHQEDSISKELLESMGIPLSMIPNQERSIGSKININNEMADLLNLNPLVTVSYRAGDQPNNAFSLNVLEPGEIAATAGTSGVIYAVTDHKISDHKSRINTFLHVNHTNKSPRYGALICVNGTGILYRWLRQLLSIGGHKITYEQMNTLSGEVSPGSSGLLCVPFGNGTERIFENQMIESHFLNLNFNTHTPSHLIRASLESIVYALNAGFEIFKELGGTPKTIRASHSNLFLSPVFREIFVNVTNTPLAIYDTDGATGAARGAALGYGFYSTKEEAFANLKQIEFIEPDPSLQMNYQRLYKDWLEVLSAKNFI